MKMTMTEPNGRVKVRSKGKLCREGSIGPLSVSALLVSAALGGACGSSSNVALVDAGTTPMDAGASIGTIVHGASQPCTEPHSICVNVKFAASMTAPPVKLQIDYYLVSPPTTPPDGVPVAIPSPDIAAGETVQLRMSDLGLTGSYNILGVVYMPGGGAYFPVAGVDYVSFSSTTYPFTGEAINVPETQIFDLLPTN